VPRLARFRERGCRRAVPSPDQVSIEVNREPIPVTAEQLHGSGPTRLGKQITTAAPRFPLPRPTGNCQSSACPAEADG
jgi:hypothetical protein